MIISLSIHMCVYIYIYIHMYLHIKSMYDWHGHRLNPGASTSTISK